MADALSARYAITRVIGSGGMASVFLADDLEHHRQVAIKMLRPELASEITNERFLQEIALTARLSHPRVVSLFDSGICLGLPYYVMTYVEGESLARRLQRERQLPIDEAVRITCQVAEGLAHAHGFNIIHRDIKPDNILLGSDGAVLGDFGIARAFSEARRLTTYNVALGTTGYMSPEQASGERNLDVRSDVYSLASVCYEMLAGETPFTGPTPNAILAKQLNLPAPRLSIVRTSIVPALDAVIQRGLASSAADRFQSVQAFADALAVAHRDGTTSRSLSRWQRVPKAAWATVIVAAVGALSAVVWRVFAPAPVPLVPSRYAVFPFTRSEAGARDAWDEVQVTRDAMARWTGITLTDAEETRRASVRGSAPDVARFAAAARRLGAAQFLSGSLAAADRDSLQVELRLYRAADGGSAASVPFRVAIASRASTRDSAFVRALDSLLLGLGSGARQGSRNLLARRAFIAGDHALREWDLAAADSGFSEAVQQDPGYARARLYAALVKAWSGADGSRAQQHADQALLGRDSLSLPEQEMAAAIAAQLNGDVPGACDRWQRLARADSLNFASWYGAALCLERDNAVVRDARSPSGWRFRASYHRALLDYQHAFRLLPSILLSYRAEWYEPLRRLFKTAGNDLRGGSAVAPDSGEFASHPSWQGDTLAFVPYPLFQRQPPPRSPSTSEAVRRQRAVVRDIAQRWVSEFPQSASAWHALAISIAMLGDASALDTLARARSHALRTDERFRIAASEVWMKVAFGVAQDRNPLLVEARALADSLLRASPPGRSTDPLVTEGLAELTGHAFAAAAYARETAAAVELSPAALQPAAPALLVFASLGGPPDSLTALEQSTGLLLRSAPAGLQRLGRQAVLARAAMLAYPLFRFHADSLAGAGNDLVDLQAAFDRGERSTVLAALKDMAIGRRGISPWELTLDALRPEADLVLLAGSPADAADWLDPTLLRLPQMAPRLLISPVRASSLVRTMALRARIAQRLNQNAEARRWARATLALWSGADPFLLSQVADLRDLAR